MGDYRYDSSSPERLKRVLDDFPKLEVIAAHFGGFMCWESARELLRRPNVKFDTSSSLFILDKAYVRELIDHYGVENCFFGTDFPLWNYGGEVERFFELDLPYDYMDRILSRNFRDYFRI
jgi:predicted TIM-barrel fold metal-dependent hydrolase